MSRHSTWVLRLIVIAAMILALAAGVAPANAQQRRRDPARQQARLVEQVRHELRMLPYYGVFDWLEFKVDDDVVTLLGQVTRPSLKSDAENRVSKLEAVARVKNQIEVLPLSFHDDRLRRAAYIRLYNANSPLFRYGQGSDPAIHIIVRGGRITLKGEVASTGDRNLAGIRALGVSGAFEVRNQLTVRKA